MMLRFSNEANKLESLECMNNKQEAESVDSKTIGTIFPLSMHDKSGGAQVNIFKKKVKLMPNENHRLHSNKSSWRQGKLSSIKWQNENLNELWLGQFSPASVPDVIVETDKVTTL